MTTYTSPRKNFEPALSKLAALGTFEKIGPLASQQIAANIMRQVDLEKIGPLVSKQAAANVMRQANPSLVEELSRSVKAATSPELSEAAFIAAKDIRSKLSGSSAFAVAAFQSALTPEVRRVLDGVSFPAGVGGEAAPESVEPDGNGLLQLPWPALVLLLGVWLEVFVALSAVAQDAADRNLPPSAQEAIEAVAKVAAAIAYTVQLRRGAGD